MKGFFRRFQITTLLFFSFAVPVVAQSDFSFAVGGGIMYYNGDLSDSKILPPSKILSPYYTADLSVLLVDRFDLSLRFLHGEISGDDALSDERDNKMRNQSFFSPIDEFNVMLRLRLFSVRSKKLINPFGMVGLGYLWFNPKDELDGKVYELQPLGTEGQFIKSGNYPAPYKLSSGSLAVGLGVFVRINDNFGVRIEGAPQITFTDYLDDTSTNYPDSLALSRTPNGHIAVQFASQRLNGYPDEGKPRGNPENDDVLVTFGVALVYTPGRNNNGSGPKPGVFKKMFKGKKGWWGISAD